MPTPPPTPIPIQIVGGPSWLDITTQLLIPLVSLGIAAAAIIYTAAAEKRRATERRTEQVTAEQNQLQHARDAYANRLIEYSRRHRDGQYASIHEHGDEWRDILTAAPDDEVGRLVTWWGQNFSELNDRYYYAPADHPRSRTQAVINLQSDYYSRVELWRREGQVSLEPPLSRDAWPPMPRFKKPVAQETPTAAPRPEER